MAQKLLARGLRQANSARPCEWNPSSFLLSRVNNGATLDPAQRGYGRCFTSSSSSISSLSASSTSLSSSDDLPESAVGTSYGHMHGSSWSASLPLGFALMGYLGRRRFSSSRASLAAEKGEKQAKVEEAKATSPPDVDPAGSAKGSRLRQIRGGPVSWLSLALAIATGAGILAYYEHTKSKLTKSVKQGPSVGRAAIGGPFLLLDHEGKPLSHGDLRGQWNLLYFGFTNCPDICPVELTKMAQAVDMLEKDYGLLVRPVFITVDPERDGVEQIKSYVKDYHPRLVGLTGTPEDIQQVAKAYRVYYMKTDDEGDNYLVDHSIIMYLMDPDMEFVKFYGKNHTADSLAKGIYEEVKEKGGDVGTVTTESAGKKKEEKKQDKAKAEEEKKEDKTKAA